MNKSHLPAKSHSRARAATLRAAGAQRSLLEPDDLDDLRADRSIPMALDADDGDWPEIEMIVPHTGFCYRGQVDDAPGSDVETDINLLLHGVSCR